VGVNRFTQKNEGLRMEMMKLDPALEVEQRERLAELRSQRDNERVAELRSHLEATALSGENLLPLFVICVENEVTLGEICHSLRQVWGEYRPGFDF
ncbi:MAG: methylmalonyl-CoA mutase, partial [Anaerolineaceae bacterium]